MMSRNLLESAQVFAGTWIANLTKSLQHPQNQFCSATLQITVEGESVTIRHIGITDAGAEEEAVNAILVDGKDYPGRSGHVLTASWLAPRVLEVVDKKDGQVEGRGTYAVSADGKTLTIAADQQVIVFERFDKP
jgi:hypothetical protein